MASSESLDVPEACPVAPVLPGISANGGILIGSVDAPTTTICSRGRSPPKAALMAPGAVTVARLAAAPPSPRLREGERAQARPLEHGQVPR